LFAVNDGGVFLKDAEDVEVFVVGVVDLGDAGLVGGGGGAGVAGGEEAEDRGRLGGAALGAAGGRVIVDIERSLELAEDGADRGDNWGPQAAGKAKAEGGQGAAGNELLHLQLLENGNLQQQRGAAGQCETPRTPI